MSLQDIFGNQLTFFILIGLALFIGRIPLVSAPFKWLETFFHEFSHGLACLFTLGKIKRIELNLNGSGTCYFQGGFMPVIAISGYLGAALWGAAIYIAAWTNSVGGSAIMIQALMAVMLFSAIIWGRDPITWFIFAVLIGVFWMPAQLPNLPILTNLMEFFGIFVVLNAIQAPLYLLNGKHVGDGAELAKRTLIPEIFWILLWFLFGCGTLFFLWGLNAPGAADVVIGGLLNLIGFGS